MSHFFRSMLLTKMYDNVTRFPDIASNGLLEVVTILRTGACRVFQNPSSSGFDLDLEMLRFCDKYELRDVGSTFLFSRIPYVKDSHLREAFCWASSYQSLAAGVAILTRGSEALYEGSLRLGSGHYNAKAADRIQSRWMYALSRAENVAAELHNDTHYKSKWEMPATWRTLAGAFIEHLIERE